MKLRITIDGKAYEAEVEVIEDEESPASLEPLQSVPASYSPPLVPEYLNRPNQPGMEDGDEKTCSSPMNGLVIAVNVEPGQAVEANELLIVLEAMKMETQVTAPRPGMVESVLVAPGDSVKVHQPLIQFE